MGPFASDPDLRFLRNLILAALVVGFAAAFALGALLF